MAINNLDDFTGVIADQNRLQRSAVLKELRKLDVTDLNTIQKVLPIIYARIDNGESIVDAAFNSLLE